MRLSQEEVDKRKAQLDSCPFSMFEHLSDLKSFFVEVRSLAPPPEVVLTSGRGSQRLCSLAGHQRQGAAGEGRGAQEPVPLLHHPGEPRRHGTPRPVSGRVRGGAVADVCLAVCR